MPYRYVAIAPTGEQVRGAIDVPSEAVAERALWDADYRVVSIRRQRQIPALESVLPSLFAVKKRTLITFSRQLATLLESGVPVMRSLELLKIRRRRSRCNTLSAASPNRSAAAAPSPTRSPPTRRSFPRSTRG